MLESIKGLKELLVWDDDPDTQTPDNAQQPSAAGGGHIAEPDLPAPQQKPAVIKEQPVEKQSVVVVHKLADDLNVPVGVLLDAVGQDIVPIGVETARRVAAGYRRLEEEPRMSDLALMRELGLSKAAARFTIKARDKVISKNKRQQNYTQEHKEEHRERMRNLMRKRRAKERGATAESQAS